MIGRALGLAVALLLTGCSDGADAEGVIDRQTFVDTWVELRRAALTSPRRTLSDEGRDSVLARHGVTEADLLRFADVRGVDPAYMVDVWTEVTARLAPTPPDSVPSSAPDSSG